MQPLAGRTNLSKLNCSLAAALNVVGDWWTLLIVRDAFLGLRRFGEFQQSLGLAKNILAARLQQLVEHGILAREGAERRPLYTLTKKGRALAPALLALMQWGDRWATDGPPPMLATDRRGKALDAVQVTTKAGVVAPEDLRFTPGPGALPRTRALMARLATRD